MPNGSNGHPSAADLASDPRGLPTLIKDLAEGSAELVRQEFRLARTEAADMGRRLGGGAASVVIGGVTALVGVVALLVGLVLLAGDQWLRDRYWLAALILTVIAGLAAAVFARRGLALLSPGHLVPDQTVATLQEDKEWLKQLRT